jgi:nitrilase
MGKSKSAPNPDHVTVAVVQAASVAFDRKRTLEKALDLIRDAAKRGAKLVLFPEAFVSGYPRGLDFGAVVGARSDEGREDFKRYYESAVDVPGPAVEILGKAARANSVYLVIGVIERERGTLYCCVLFFAPDGTFLGKHRKVMPTASERLIWGYGDGSTLPVFSTPFGRLGAVICWENYMPLLRTYMYSQGIEIYCAPTADHRQTWSATMQHIAAEGRCFVLGCNQFNRRCNFPEKYRTAFGEAPDTVISRGGSCIVDPFGKFLAGPDFEDETILVAELDRGLIPKARFDFDPVGHYSRPDIFRMIVDDRPKPPVTTVSEAEPPIGTPAQSKAKTQSK